MRISDWSSDVCSSDLTPRDGTQHEQPSTARAPNILVIVADDLGYQDVGFNGASFPTPNIDRIADRGMVLDHFYTSALCSPSPAGLLTGRDRTGVLQGKGVSGRVDLGGGRSITKKKK